MMRSMFRQLWAEPAIDNPPTRRWDDWVLVALLVPTAVLEAILRKDLGWPVVALLIGVPPMFMLPFRRSHPLHAIVVVFGCHALAEAVTLIGAPYSAMLIVTAYALLLPYSLTRWGSGRQAIIGMSIVLFMHVPRWPLTWQLVGEVVGGSLFLLLPAALGAAMRYRSTSRLRERDQAKLLERAQLARELHDTVAHHVSAIIIQAQAGSTVAASDPAAAVRALHVIEQEASRTLGEMRIMVSALRQGDDPALSPQCGVGDLHRLARTGGPPPLVQVRTAGGLDDLRPSLSAAIYRLAQESITNAIRHARHATRVEVSVDADDSEVRLTVRDDGDAGAFDHGSASGYGLVGMTERAALLGGSFSAGPLPSGGWTVTAVLPRSGRRS